MSNDLDRRVETVESILGFKLRSHQDQALRALGQGKNVILHVPTGGGKTVAFQGAPYVTPHKGITVILYPLRALVKDQTRRFKELGLPAVTLYGETPTKERAEIYDKILGGVTRLLLTTPESFDMNKKLQSVLARRGVSVLTVDEAHAYEEWADGFRPTYRRAGAVAKAVGVKQFLLCSATLTKKGFKTACETLGVDKWTIVQVPPIRDNLVYRDLSYPEHEILCRAVDGTGLAAPGIVFFTTVKRLNETAAYVETKTGKKVLRYNGQMTAKNRKDAQEAFMRDDAWIFATKAFGMGIDKDNIRNIIHMQLPSSVLSYAQECGRAGRDGEESMCFLTQEEQGQAAHFLIDMSVPSVGHVRKVWNALQRVALDWVDWFEVDWNVLASELRMSVPQMQACVSWLFTGRMLEKRQKRLSWKINIHAESDAKAAKYKRKTPEILEAFRSELMIDDGPAEFHVRPEQLSEIVGSMFSNWRAKLRKMNELDILRISEPPKTRSRYRFRHNSFRFEQGQEQLEKARSRAFERLAAMRSLQNCAPHSRQEAIEDAISLKITAVEGLEILDSDSVQPVVTEIQGAEPPDPWADDEEFTVPF